MTIAGGAWQANDGGGLPAASNLALSGGGVLQSDGPANFTRTAGTAAGQVQWTGDGGFAANGGRLTVNLNGGTQLVWGSTTGFLPNGNTLVFGTPTANNVAELQNSIDLNGAVRTVLVNSGAGGDSALLSGNIIDSTNTNGGLNKTGSGLLALSGSNTFGGGATVAAGTLQLASSGALLNSTGTVNSGENLNFGAGVTAATVGGLAGNGSVSLATADATPGASR